MLPEEDNRVILILLYHIYLGDGLNIPSTPFYQTVSENDSSKPLLTLTKAFIAAQKYRFNRFLAGAWRDLRSFVSCLYAMIDKEDYRDTFRRLYRETGHGKVKKLMIFWLGVAHAEHELSDRFMLELLEELPTSFALDIINLRSPFQMIPMMCNSCYVMLPFHKFECWCGLQGLCSETCFPPDYEDVDCPSCKEVGHVEPGEDFMLWVDGKIHHCGY